MSSVGSAVVDTTGSSVGVRDILTVVAGSTVVIGCTFVVAVVAVIGFAFVVFAAVVVIVVVVVAVVVVVIVVVVVVGKTGLKVVGSLVVTIFSVAPRM